MNKNEGQSGQGFAQERTGAQALDARYSEERHNITDRLRTTMGSNAQGDFIVIGQKQDGSPFLWSSADQDKTQALAKAVAPELVGLAPVE